MRLGELRDTLQKAPPNWPVHVEVEGERMYARGLISWRGSYGQCSLDWDSREDIGAPITVGKLLSQVELTLMGIPMHGYKGGDYVMDEDVPVWADPYGVSQHRVITRVRDDIGATLRFETYLIPGEYQ